MLARLPDRRPLMEPTGQTEPFNSPVGGNSDSRPLRVGASVFAWVFLRARDPCAKMPKKTNN